MAENKGRDPEPEPNKSDVRSDLRNEGGPGSWAEKRENAAQTGLDLAQSSEYRYCWAYIRTGQCKYGEHCQYNHPQLPERNQMSDEMVQTCPTPVRAQLPESNQMKHEMGQTSSYPVRPGAKDCEYYLKTGLRSFGSDCRFNHPPNHVAKGGRMKAIRLKCKFLKGGNCMNGSSCGYYHLMDTAATTSYRSSDEGRHGTESCSMAEKRENATQTIRDLAQTSEYRVRPRVAEDCRHYVKTGQCKYEERCKFNHPQVKHERVQTSSYPVRPDAKDCKYYLQTGLCSSGSDCRFNHPTHAAKIWRPKRVIQEQQQKSPQKHQWLAYLFNLSPLLEKLADATETGTRDQNCDALVTELISHFSKCQQLLNSISESLGSKTMTLDGERRKLED